MFNRELLIAYQLLFMCSQGLAADSADTTANQAVMMAKSESIKIEQLADIYELMKHANFDKAEKALEQLYQKDRQVLPLWVALLTELERFDRLRELVDEGILDPGDDSAVLALAYKNRSAPTLEFVAPQGQIPLESHFLVTLPRAEVQINGKTFYFVLDTGASTNVITQRVADTLSIVADKRHQVSIDTATDNEVFAQVAILPSFRLGPAELRNQAAVIVDNESLEQRILGFNWYQLDGIIGWPVLKKMDLSFNFAEMTLAIQQPMKKTWKIPNLVWLFDDPMVLTHSREKGSLLWFLDTGAMHSQVTERYLVRHAIDNLEWKSKQFSGLGGKGKEEKTANLESIKFDFPSAKVNVEDIEVRVDHEDCKYSLCDGRIGVDIGNNRIMNIDFYNGLFDVWEIKQ
ncbi:TIGR02281 family clan AA aspartic protease [Photobacterium sp. OFAV2-7]|uniref:retropepsin-like aspartic protease family protein n=1 Tax=Photobacterium sp. OFAV2-7 TaxID=2917748 RepID=UPI001EF4CC6C|nr:retropepsin-like aspartic protease [Photobacterium sp. OFAV2-7]MCG7584918.1 retroviral-like aspartic protease family protein [Photobacterium sp. OFAV2-7]